jgi:hypothetical protein
MDIVEKPASELLAGAGDALRLLRERLAYTRTPEYRAELRRQAALVRGTPEDAEALDFIEAAIDTESWDAVAADE